MAVDFHQLPHAGIRTLTPYKPGKPIVEVAREFGLKDIIKLASNENPLGCSPRVMEALSALPNHLLATYPSAINHPLQEKLAAHLNTEPNQLILSNGSDYIYLLLFMAFALHTNKHVLTHDYAFSTYQIQAQGLGIPVVSAKIQANWQVDIQQLIDTCTKDTGLICLANPNNPTGTFIPESGILKLLDNIPESTLLVLDEAYYEYVQQDQKMDSIAWLKRYPNLVITRTFSKAYGLAGLRLGYAIANPDIISLLQKLQLPFAVNQIALEAGFVALDDAAFMEKTLQSYVSGMAQMRNGLCRLDIEHIPSTANFVTVDCAKDGLPIYQALLAQGVIVRPLHAYNMPNHIRVTIGTEEQNTRFLKALQTIFYPGRNHP
jgi:histidinol-phosphate aminotransferase